MNYHIVLSTPFDLEKWEQDANEGKCPRHIMWDLTQKLSAQVHQPNPAQVQLIDQLLSKLISQPQHWALARQLVAQLDDNDVVFCAGEDVGIPLAILCTFKQNRPKLAMVMMVPQRLRTKGLLKLFKLSRTIDLFFTDHYLKSDFLRQLLGLSKDRVYQLREQTDVKFFKPGVSTLFKARPLLFSAGLEQRDYKTLAEATKDLPIDVKVCALSPNASKNTRVAFPNPIPENMEFHPYPWTEFLQMYHNADLVVISLLEHDYSAGLTSLMESMACRRPTIITRTCGTGAELIDGRYVMGVLPGDVTGMKQAILDLLENPQAAETLAQRGYERVLQQHSSEQYVTDLVDRLIKIGSFGN